ncbi:MAG TPA: hypothetical protein VFD07_03605 [Candidatus Krumholzibacteria bacterium]|nr:hypothetical protein [Candidatus Krumholzibacteria bacterium]
MRAILGLVPIAIFLGLATHASLETGLQPDDAGYTALRVATNFRSGEGLAFNPGERRDLTDSPAWLGILTLLSFSQQAPLAMQILGLALGAAALLLVIAGPRDPLVGAGAALFVALDGVYVSGATSGASEPLVALYLVALVPILRMGKAQLHADMALAIWAASAGIVRHELVMVAIPVAIGAGFREPRRVLAWLPLVTATLSALVCLALRGAYFGEHPAYWEPWPPSAGSMYRAASVVLDLLLRRPLLLLALAFLVSEWLHGKLWLGRRIGLAWGLLALALFSVAPGRGGDVERIVGPMLPLGSLLAVEEIWRRTRTRPAVVAALLLVLAQPGWTTGGRKPAPEVDVAYERIGRWLETHADNETIVGAARVGALGYHSGLRVEDVQGRVSPRVAAARRLGVDDIDDVDAAYGRVFKLEPDLMFVLPGDPVPSARTYVPNDDALPAVIRGPFRVYRWAGSTVWRSAVPAPAAPPFS